MEYYSHQFDVPRLRVALWTGSCTFGGYINGTYKPTSRSDVYKAADNTWTRITDLPKLSVMSGSRGWKRHLSGGYPGTPTGGQIFATQDVWKYNVDAKTWTALRRSNAGLGSWRLDRELHHRRRGYQPRIKAITGSVARWRTQWQGATPLPNHAVIWRMLYWRKDSRHRSAGTDDNLVTQNPWMCGIQPNQTPGRQLVTKARSHSWGQPCDQQSYHRRRRRDRPPKLGVRRQAYDPLSIPGQLTPAYSTIFRRCLLISKFFTQPAALVNNIQSRALNARRYIALM